MSEATPLGARLAETDARSLDLRFTDLLGAWRHLTIDGTSAADAHLDRLCHIDGSAMPGWRDPIDSDLLLQPQPECSWADPFTAQPTLTCIADVVDPATREGYPRCPRSALKRTLATLRARGLADTVHVGADLAFYVFDRLEVTHTHSALGVDASPVPGGAPVTDQAAYMAGQPQDALADLRAEIASVLASLGVSGLSHLLMHARGQCELCMGPADALTMADQLQLARYVIDNVARAYGKVVSFLPVPAPELAPSGLHLHVNFERGGEWSFAGRGYADLSDSCLNAIGGLLRHTPVLNAFTNPSTNSYRRLYRPRQEPAWVGFGAHNRLTAIRIPAAVRPEEKRIELRFPDPLANPYLALAATLHAMRDGIDETIDPGEPVDGNVYDLGRDETMGLDRCARTLTDALNALEAARAGLFAGDAVPGELIDAYAALKRAEIERIATLPHPMEHIVYGI